MNARKYVSLLALLLVLPGVAIASVKNVLSFKDGNNPKPTTIELTKFNHASGAGLSNSKIKQSGQPLKRVSIEFKPGKEAPAAFKAQAAIDELSIETKVEIPGQTKIDRTTTFRKVVVTSVKVDGAGNDAIETVEFSFEAADTTQKS